jgi:hypothetical protein
VEHALFDHGDPSPQDQPEAGRQLGEAEGTGDHVDHGRPGVFEDGQQTLIGPGPAGDRLVAGRLLLDVEDERFEAGPEPLVGRQVGVDVDHGQQLGRRRPQDGDLEIGGGWEIVEDQALRHATGPGDDLGRHLVEPHRLHQGQADGHELGSADVGAEPAAGDGRRRLRVGLRGHRHVLILIDQWSIVE